MVALFPFLCSAVFAQTATRLDPNTAYDIKSENGSQTYGTATCGADDSFYDFVDNPDNNHKPNTNHSGWAPGTSKVYQHTFTNDEGGTQTHYVTFYDDGTWIKRDSGGNTVDNGSYEEQ